MSDKELKEKLKQAKKENEDKVNLKKEQDLAGDFEKLQKAYQEQSEIAIKAQRDYVNLKFDFDRYQRQNQEREKDQETNSLISSIKKILPFVENLRKSLENIPQDQKMQPLSQGVQLVYDNFIKTLESINIFQIKAVGLEPDSILHEPVSVMPVDDKKMKGKIIQEFERGFIYKKDDKQIVISTSKVIVGQ